MRKLLLITLPFLLIVGCSKEPINYETIFIERDGLYTNWYKNGQKRDELTIKDGKFDGFILIGMKMDRRVSKEPTRMVN